MPFQNNVLAGASGATGYQIPYSLRFRAANSAYLSRTLSAPTDGKKYTFSAWVKFGDVGTTGSQYLISSTGGTYEGFFRDATTSGARTAGALSFFFAGGTAVGTTALLRDPSAWYHIILSVDTTQATAADRVKIYIPSSGSTVALTNNASSSYPSLNSNMGINSAVAHALGRFQFSANQYLDGYMAEVNFIDGQALTPSSFGQTDSATGVWVPKKYSGTYGTNGFYLKFADATSTTTIGNDSSGNGNNWTSSGISVTSGVTYDQMLDTPTLNYAAFNQIDQVGGTNTLTASLDITTSSSVISAALGTFWRSSGKWYWEFVVNGVAGICQIGIAKTPIGTISTNGPYQSANVYTYISNGNKGNNNTSSAYGASYTTNDVIGVALDLDAGTLVFYKNNVSQGTAFSSLSGEFSLIVGDSGNASTISGSLNCGQRAFAYTPPSGFKALNTANLPMPSIKKGSLYMDATLRTGTGATASVSSLGFQPDLVWIKGRSGATDHGLYDAVRGVQLQLESNTTTDETTETTGLTAFNSNGYTVGALAQLNTNTATYVDWAWKEGVTPGFDIVTYTGNGVARTISHTLGAAPKFMIVKARSTASTDQGWPVYHAANTAAPETDYLLLNSNAGTADLDTVWNDTAPTASVFSVGTNALVNANADTYVAYLWSEIEGFSKISSYTGNGSTDGPFVWCGFRPRYVLIKSGGVENWSVQDSARNPYNVVDARLKPNSADAEGVGSAQNVDFLSNGFKLRTTDPEKNSSSVTYVFAAFAENPFKYSRAR